MTEPAIVQVTVHLAATPQTSSPNFTNAARHVQWSEGRRFESDLGL
jgi:hypothetical protein